MTTNLSASVLARLLNLAKQRGEDYNLLLNRFALERLLCRVAASPHADRFLLKGALLFALWYDEPHRPTRDADLLGSGPDDADSLIAIFRDVASIDMDDGIAFDPQSVRADTISRSSPSEPNSTVPRSPGPSQPLSLDAPRRCLLSHPWP